MELKDILVIVMWAVPLVFGAGSIYFLIQSLQKRVEVLEKRMDEHVAKPGHDVMYSEMKNMKESQTVIFARLDEYSRTLGTATTKLAEVVALMDAERKASSSRT